MEIPNLKKAPVTPEETLDWFNSIIDTVNGLGQQMADMNRLPNEKKCPWHSLRVIRIIPGIETLSAGWFWGCIQYVDSVRKSLDPYSPLSLKSMYSDENSRTPGVLSTTPDCFVIAFEENGASFNGGGAPLHRWKTDGSVFVIGWFQGYAFHPPEDSTDDRTVQELPVFMGISRPTAAPLPCTLSNPVGSAGSNGPPPTPATYVYDVYDLDGNLVQAGAALWTARQHGHVTAATKGFYFSDYDDSFKIIWCDEVLDTTACTP
jgi:hypothetical protein